MSPRGPALPLPAAPGGQPSPPGAGWLKVSQVAEIYQVSCKTVWRWCRTGKLPASRIGRTWRVPSESVTPPVKED